MTYGKLVGVDINIGPDFFVFELMVMFKPVDNSITPFSIAAAHQLSTVASGKDGGFANMGARCEFIQCVSQVFRRKRDTLPNINGGGFVVNSDGN
jgi:hypothetical protein